MRFDKVTEVYVPAAKGAGLQKGPKFIELTTSLIITPHATQLCDAQLNTCPPDLGPLVVTPGEGGQSASFCVPNGHPFYLTFRIAGANAASLPNCKKTSTTYFLIKILVAGVNIITGKYESIGERHKLEPDTYVTVDSEGKCQRYVHGVYLGRDPITKADTVSQFVMYGGSQAGIAGIGDCLGAGDNKNRVTLIVYACNRENFTHDPMGRKILKPPIDTASTNAASTNAASTNVASPEAVIAGGSQILERIVKSPFPNCSVHESPYVTFVGEADCCVEMDPYQIANPHTPLVLAASQEMPENSTLITSQLNGEVVPVPYPLENFPSNFSASEHAASRNLICQRIMEAVGLSTNNPYDRITSPHLQGLLNLDFLSPKTMSGLDSKLIGLFQKIQDAFKAFAPYQRPVTPEASQIVYEELNKLILAIIQLTIEIHLASRSLPECAEVITLLQKTWAALTVVFIFSPTFIVNYFLLLQGKIFQDPQKIYDLDDLFQGWPAYPGGILDLKQSDDDILQNNFNDPQNPYSDLLLRNFIALIIRQMLKQGRSVLGISFRSISGALHVDFSHKDDHETRQCLKNWVLQVRSSFKGMIAMFSPPSPSLNMRPITEAEKKEPAKTDELYLATLEGLVELDGKQLELRSRIRYAGDDFASNALTFFRYRRVNLGYQLQEVLALVASELFPPLPVWAILLLIANLIHPNQSESQQYAGVLKILQKGEALQWENFCSGQNQPMYSTMFPDLCLVAVIFHRITSLRRKIMREGLSPPKCPASCADSMPAPQLSAAVVMVQDSCVIDPRDIGDFRRKEGGTFPGAVVSWRNPSTPDQPPSQLLMKMSYAEESRLLLLEALQELVIRNLYHLAGINVPKVYVGNHELAYLKLPDVRVEARDNLVKMVDRDGTAGPLPHVYSGWCEGFVSFKDLTCDDNGQRMPFMTFLRERRSLPRIVYYRQTKEAYVLKNLDKLLATAYLIGHLDPIGYDGSNAGVELVIDPKTGAREAWVMVIDFGMGLNTDFSLPDQIQYGQGTPNDPAILECTCITKDDQEREQMFSNIAAQLTHTGIGFTPAHLGGLALLSELETLCLQLEQRVRVVVRENLLRSGASRGAQTADVAEQDEETPYEFFCPITLELMKDPVKTYTDHVFDRSAIELWLANHDTNPLTNEKLANKSLIPQHALRERIIAYQERHRQVDVAQSAAASEIPVVATPASAGIFSASRSITEAAAPSQSVTHRDPYPYRNLPVSHARFLSELKTLPPREQQRRVFLFTRGQRLDLVGRGILEQHIAGVDPVPASKALRMPGEDHPAYNRLVNPATGMTPAEQFRFG